MPNEITDITIYQSNKVGTCNLLSVHQPLVFLVDATYTGTVPEALHVNVNDELNTLGTYTCIPYQDVQYNIRRYAFVADGILRSYMDGIEDIDQEEKTLILLENLTKYFELDFFDPLNVAEHEAITFIACHGAGQFGETPAQQNIFNNTNITFVGADSCPVYVYYYNSVDGAVITMSDALTEYPALDYDDELFADRDGVLFYAQFETPGPEPVMSCSEYGLLPLDYFETSIFNTAVYNCTFLELE